LRALSATNPSPWLRLLLSQSLSQTQPNAPRPTPTVSRYERLPAVPQRCRFARPSACHAEGRGFESHQPPSGRLPVCGTSLVPTAVRRQAGHGPREGFGDGIGDRPDFAASPDGRARPPDGTETRLVGGFPVEVSDGTRTRDRLDHNQEPQVAPIRRAGRSRDPAALDLALRRCDGGPGAAELGVRGRDSDGRAVSSARGCDQDATCSIVGGAEPRIYSPLGDEPARAGFPAIAGIFMISPNPA
jgi:hypothetical protein